MMIFQNFFFVLLSMDWGTYKFFLLLLLLYDAFSLVFTCTFCGIRKAGGETLLFSFLGGCLKSVPTTTFFVGGKGAQDTIWDGRAVFRSSSRLIV